MNNPQNPSWTAVAVTTSRRLSLAIKALITGMLCMAGQVNAQAPDLTDGELPVNPGAWINLGPTGVQAWVYRGIEGNPTTNTGLSRQFQVKTIEAGSPAAGILAVDDVILGADGTGATPVSFTSDARKSFAYAIGDAEARTPATLKLLVWRAGTTSTMTLTLRTMGAYSPTAPFNCPKSAKILDEGLDYAMANQDAGYVGISALALMAANNPADPKNGARQARAQTYALAQMLAPGVIQYINDGNVEITGSLGWDRGLRLVVLAEYYLKTGDTQVLPSIEAIALSIAHGQGANGAVGHLFNTSIKDGIYNEPFSRGYTMNASTLPTALGLVLARKCGVTLPELDPAIERVTRTLAGSPGIGTFDYYVEGEPYPDSNEDNGKSSLGAIVFAMHNDRVKEAKFMANLAVGGAYSREDGHITHYFGLLWGPLGCQVGGQAAAVAHFNEIRWLMDLNRHWDGDFEYERDNWFGSANTPAFVNGGRNFHMSTAALLTYAMPLNQLEITGKTFSTRPELALSGSEIAAGVLSNSYDATTRTTAELMQDLQFELTRTSGLASKELAARPADAVVQVPTLISRAADPAGPGRTGACLALGEIGDDAAVPTLLALLTDADKNVRYRAAEALTKFPTQLLRENLYTLLQAAIANAKPAFPLDFSDSQQLAQLKLSEVIFGTYGTQGAINNDLASIDRALLYPAIRAFASHPHSKARDRVAALYNKLTPADVTALSDVLIDGANFFGVSNVTPTPGLEAIKVLERDDWAEGIPLLKDYFINSRFTGITAGLTELQDYGAAALTVTPNPQVIDFLNSMLGGEYESRTADTDNAQIIAIRDALLAASNPPVLPSFKSIQSVTASPAALTLPARQTQLNVSFTDLSQGDTIFSWRKVYGPGIVTFSTNNTVGSAAPQAYFDGVPGIYLFEVKAWDSRNLTEVTGTVQVELRDSGGSLPANSPPTATAQSVTALQVLPTPIILTGTDPEGYPFAAFEVVSGPGNGTLGGTPPFVTYTSGFNFTGADSFSFRVRDSNGQWSAPASVSITVATRISPVGLVVHEPVSYAPGAFNGKSGSSEIGFAGSWLAQTGGASVMVEAASLAYGGMPTAGGSLKKVGFTSRALSPALATSGLLNDGATLWFSMQVGLDSSSSLNNMKLRWALANSSFNSTTMAIQDEGPQLGRGVGFFLSGDSVWATSFLDPSTTDFSAYLRSEESAKTGINTGLNRLLIGKITWGMDQDSIQLYLPTTDLILGSPVASLNTVVDQSTFDTITTTQSSYTMDEIRLGATLESVLLGTVAMPADNTPPSPTPMTFGVAPSLATPTSATMQAATAFDANYGVEYYFTCTAGGGHNSGWQSSPVYTATGLTPGVSYSYTVKARDRSPALNETAPSAAFSVGTPAATVVPALVNVSQAEAEALITSAGLVVGTVTTSSSLTIEAGNLSSQSPSGGTSAAVGSAVNLVVSSTVQMATVPNVVGQTQAAAPSSLAAANLTLGTVLTDYSETIAAGVVMSQNPASGASLPRSSPVALVVSAGSATGLAPLTQVFLEGFESPDVNSSVVVNTTVGGSLPNNGQWGATTGAAAAGKGIIDKASGAFTALDPNHQAFAIRSTDAGIVSAYNKIGTITAGTKYTVAVDIVKDSGQNNGTLADFQLKSFDQTATASTSRDATTEGTVILSRSSTAPVDGTFKTVTFEYVATGTNPYLGKDLAVRIAGGTSAANMDNVRVWTSGARLADTAAPWVLSKAPADDSTAVVGNSDLTHNFSESVKAGNGYITLKNLTNGSQRLISITDTRQVAFSGSTLTINPERNLLGLSDYAVLIGYDAVRDLAGNPFEGVSDPAAWNFSTGASSDSTAPTVISITDDRGGSPVVTGALVTYTVTFSEDMDADSVIASDFGNAGSSALKFMGLTEVSPGVFTVSVIPTSLGTLQLRINAGSALTDASGNALNTSGALADDTVITVNLGIMAPVWSGNPVVGTNAPEDSAYSSTLHNYATDANGDPLTFTKISGPTWLSVATNGNLSGTPTNSNVGLNTFIVSMTDGKTAPAQATLNISVINTNDAPTFTQNPIYTPAAVRHAAYASSIAGYAADVDLGASLVFAKTGGPAWLIVAANGDLSGTPSTGDLGTNTFTVTVSDGIALPVSATLPIKVNATEPAVPAIYEPFAASDPFLQGNTPGTGLAGTWAGSTAVAVTSPSFFYGALPSIGGKVVQPYGNASSVATGNSLLDAGLLANGATLWFSFVQKADDATNSNDESAFALGSAPLATNLGTSMLGTGIGLYWKNGEGFQGSYWNTTKVISATKAGTSSKVPTLVVASITWGADDTANETLSIYLPDRSIAMPASPAIVYTVPARAQSTFQTLSFVSRNTDGSSGLFDEFRFGSSYDFVTGQAQITGDGTPPTLAVSAIVDDQGGATVAAGTVVNYTMTFSEDMNAATVGADDFSNAGSAAMTIGSIVETGPGVFTVQATPTTGGTLRLQVAAGAFLADMGGNLLVTSAAISDDTTITVTSSNSAPVWTSNPIDEANASEGIAYSGTLDIHANDTNADPLTFAKVSGPAWLNIAADGSLSGTPTNNDVGANSFTVSVSDGIATAVQTTLNITVINTNNAPTWAANPVAGANATEDAVYSGSISGSASDVDAGATLTFAKVSGPAWLSVAANGALSGTPANNDVGANSFTVSVSDGIAAAVQTTLNITVINTNDAPTWAANPIAGTNATEDVVYSGTLAGGTSDVDVSAILTFAKVSGPAWLSVGSNGAISGTPTTANVGANVFTVSVTDGIAAPVEATLNILVNASTQSTVVVYEPFADSDGTLSGNTPGSGLKNTWTSGAASITSNLTYGSLPTSGNSVATTAGASGWNNASVALATTGTTLSSSGLLNHGTQMWFSVLLRRDTTAARFAMSIGDSGFSTNGDLSPLASQGIGFGVATDNKIYASVWATENWGATNLGGPPASWISGGPVLPLGQLNLVVGKVEWGANGTANDRVTLYLPGTDLVLGSPVAVAEGIVSQEDGTFDTLGLHAITNVSHLFDEIRYGSSYESIIGASGGGDTTPPTLVGTNIVDDQSGAPVTVGTLVTYTVTFSEDINSTTVSAADFGNTGSAAVTIGTITETSPGVFAVQVTPTTSGTLQLRVNAGAGINDVSGNALNTALAIADNTTITVNAVNVAPVWASNPVNEVGATEDLVYSSTLADNASDANGDSLTFAKVSGPAWLSVAANGDLSGTPTNSDVGANSFTVSVNDGIATAVTATLNITVTNTNDAPTWAANPVAGADATEDALYSGSIAGSASDVDTGATLTFAKVSGPAWMSVAPNGSLSGTPANSDVGANSFTVSVTDGIAIAVTTTLNITVTNTNDAPTWAANPVAGADATEDALYSGSIAGSASDVDAGATLTFAKVSGPAWLSVAPTGALSGTPSNGDVGVNSFTVSVDDGIATAVTATLNITVTNTNDAPAWVANPIAVANATEDAVYSGSIAGSASDVDAGAALAFAKVSGPAWLSIAANGALSGTPTNSEVGANSFTVSVTDGIATAVTATLNITVINTNDAPVAVAQSFTTDEDTALPITLAGTDDDNDALSYTIVTQPANGTLSGTAPNMTYTPSADSNGADSFTFKVNDGAVDSALATVSLTVTPVNDAPVAVAQGVTTAEDTALPITLAGTDVDLDTLSYTIVTAPTNGTLSGTVPNLTYTPSANYNGADSFTFVVNDGTVDSALATVSITVTPVNDAPVAVAQSVATAEDTALPITLAGTDIENSALTYTIVTPPANGTLGGTAPNLTYTPSANYSGADSFVFTVNDGTVDSPPATIAITVTPVNDAPVAAAQSPATAEDTALPITLAGTDVDGNPLTYSVVSQPANGTLGGTAPNVTYTPSANYSGADSFTFTANDGTLNSALATVLITVTPVNDAPTWSTNPIAGTNATEDTAYAATLTSDASDVDAGAILTYAKVSGPAWLSIAPNGTVSGTPANADVGANSFTVSVSDGIALPVESTLNITVTNTNDAPTWSANPFAGTNATEDTAYAATLTSDASDVDAGAILTYAKVSGPAWLSIAPNGTVSGTPANADVGANSFTVSVSDGIAAPVQATLNIQVNASGSPTTTIYEPFADSDPTLSGNTPGTGLSGTWATSGTTWNVASPGLTYGSLPTSGNRASNSPRGAHSITTGTVGNNSLLNAGLLNHGQTLWFSFLWKMDDVVVSNGDAAFVLGTDSLNGGSNNGMPMLNAGSGIGVSMGTYNGTLTAGSWSGGLRAAGSPAASWGSRTVAKLIVGKITWGVDGLANDVIEIYSPGTDLTLPGSPVSSKSAVLDQSLFDAISFATKTEGDPQIDEIRFGASYESIIGASGGGDTTPPTLVGTNIVDNQSGAPVTVGTLVTYTVTFSEDIDDTTVTAADFGNAGTSSVTIGTITESVPGVFTVQVTPTTSGTLQLQVNAGAVIADVSGNALNTASAIADNTTITVNSVNVAPMWASNPVIEVGATEDVVYSSTLADNASDANGDPLTYAKVSGPAWLSIAPNGALSGTPDNDAVGTNVFTVSVSDGIAIAAEATLNITVVNTNDAPTWASNPVNGANATEDAAYTGSIAGSASDVDTGATLTYAKVSGPAWLTVGTDGALSGTPANDAVGANVFTVSVSDGIAIAVETTLNITVVNTNDAPIWASNPVNGANATEDAAYTGSIAGSASDADAGATLTYAKVSGPAWLSIAPNGTVSGTPANADVGANSYTVSVSDGIALPVESTLNITVDNANDAPTWAANPIAGANATEDVVYSGTLADGASDVDASATLTFAKVSGPAWLSVGSNGALSGTPTNTDVGANSFTVSVSDGIALPVESTLNITVDNANDAPTWAANPIAGANATEDVFYSGSLAGSASDVDTGATLTFAKVSGPAWLSVGSNGALSGTPTNTDVGANSFTVSVSDGIALPVESTLNITVDNANDAPTWAANPIAGTNATEDVVYSGSLAGSASDVDTGATLTYAKVSGPAWLTVGTDGALSGTPANDAVGANVFTVSVSDGIPTAVQTTLNITVINANDAPVFTLNPIAAAGASEGLAYTGQTLAGQATDADAGDTITYSKVSGPTWLAVAANGALSGTPPAGTAGLNSFVVRATDSASATADATLQITVAGLPLPWVAADIGTGMLGGSTTFSGGTFTQAGSGIIGSTSDKLRFTYQTLTGDGEIIARISNLQNTGTSSRVGVMIRDTLATNSKQILMGMTSSGSYRWVRRTATGGTTSSNNSSSGTIPNTWVRLVRSGTTITAYKSTDGTSWTSVGNTTDTTFNSTCYIGLAVGSGSDTTLNTSQFSNVSVTP